MAIGSSVMMGVALLFFLLCGGMKYDLAVSSAFSFFHHFSFFEIPEHHALVMKLSRIVLQLLTKFENFSANSNGNFFFYVQPIRLNKNYLEGKNLSAGSYFFVVVV
jgi:hypothetical protein